MRMYVYRLRLYPTAAQERMLFQFCAATRRAYNWAIDKYRAVWDHNGNLQEGQEPKDKPSAYDLMKELGQLKRQEKTDDDPRRDLAWLKEVQAQSVNQSVLDAERSMQAFFRHVKNRDGSDFPHFRRRYRNESFKYQQGLKATERKVYLPKIGWVEYRDRRTPAGTIKQAVVKLESGRWFISLFCEQPWERPSVEVSPTTTIGVAFDLAKRQIALSTGERLPGPQYLDADLDRLRKAHRAVSRKVKGSANRRKAIKKLQRVYDKIENKRKDHLNKQTTDLAKQYNGFVFPDLDIAKALKGAKMPRTRRVYDMAPGEFRARVKYKADWAGKPYVEVPCERSGDSETPATSRANEIWAAGLVVLASRPSAGGEKPVEGAANPLPGNLPLAGEGEEAGTMPLRDRSSRGGRSRRG